MGKRTTKEREGDYRKDQAGYFIRLKQILSSPEFETAWEDLERLWEAEKEASRRFIEIDHEISTHPQNVGEVSVGGASHRGVRPLAPTDPVWGPKLKEYDRCKEQLRAAKDAYDEAESTIRRRFKISVLPGPRQGATLTGLRSWDLTRFLRIPGILDDQVPVQIVFPRPPDGQRRFRINDPLQWEDTPSGCGRGSPEQGAPGGL